MSYESIQGAWRIEEFPTRHKKPHAYGGRNSHWIIIGDRGIVIRDKLPQPLRFDFRLRLDDSCLPNECGILGKHGFLGAGYYELDGDLLFIGLGFDGGRPPRFASDCGSFFSFIRDRNFPVPDVPSWPRMDVVSETLGTLVWDDRIPEYMGNWEGTVDLPDGTECEIWASDYLIPIAQYLHRLEDVYDWLCDNLEPVKIICAKKVAEWVDEDKDYFDMAEDQIADTISITQIHGRNGELNLWASTSIPIDHVIRVWLDIDGCQVNATGASIEG